MGDNRRMKYFIGQQVKILESAVNIGVCICAVGKVVTVVCLPKRDFPYYTVSIEKTGCFYHDFDRTWNLNEGDIQNHNRIGQQLHFQF